MKAQTIRAYIWQNCFHVITTCNKIPQSNNFSLYSVATIPPPIFLAFTTSVQNAGGNKITIPCANSAFILHGMWILFPNILRLYLTRLIHDLRWNCGLINTSLLHIISRYYLQVCPHDKDGIKCIPIFWVKCCLIWRNNNIQCILICSLIMHDHKPHHSGEKRSETVFFC